MYRKVGLILSFMGLSLLAMACSDDTNVKLDKGVPQDSAVKQDKGGTTQDKGGTTQDKGGTTQDKGGTTGDGGSAAWGQKCTGTCPGGLECVQVGSTSYCTKTCTNMGQACTGAPTGTGAYCILSNSAKTKYWCGFLCKASSQTWKCPTGLKCGTTEKPAKSGQYWCE